MNYRPICDTWILARSRVNYYGAYPAGFLHRARALLGVGSDGVVLHVCAGRIRDYPFRGLGAHDKTIDLDPATEPDMVMDVNYPLPWLWEFMNPVPVTLESRERSAYYDAVLIDRPYSDDDADHYVPGRTKLPPLNLLLGNALHKVKPGGRVGVLDYLWPHPGKLGREVAVVSVTTGRNNRGRLFTVFEREDVK